MENSIRLEFLASNNVAEYEALVIGVDLKKKKLDIRRLKIFGDSQLVVGQVNEEYTIKDERMEAYKKVAHARTG